MFSVGRLTPIDRRAVASRTNATLMRANESGDRPGTTRRRDTTERTPHDVEDRRRTSTRARAAGATGSEVMLSGLPSAPARAPSESGPARRARRAPCARPSAARAAQTEVRSSAVRAARVVRARGGRVLLLRARAHELGSLTTSRARARRASNRARDSIRIRTFCRSRRATRRDGRNARRTPRGTPSPAAAGRAASSAPCRVSKR